MARAVKAVTVVEEAIINKIYLIRGQKVMIDRDLAELYGVETKYLKRQVKRNVERFPKDFMFQLNARELGEWRCQNGTSNSGDNMGLRYAPYAFTEQGVAMLSTVLNSEKAIKVNIEIMRIYTKMRKMIVDNKEILQKLDQLEKQTYQNTIDIKTVFDHLKQFLIPVEQIERRRIGFKRQHEDQADKEQ